MKLQFEKVPRPPTTSFACLSQRGPVFDCPYHVHPELEILHIESSRGRFVAGDHIGQFAPGDLFLLGAGLPHTFVNDASESTSSTWARSRFIQFTPDCLGPRFFEMPEMEEPRRLIERSVRGLVFGKRARRRALPLLDAVFKERGPGRLARFLELLAVLADASDAQPLASALFEPATHHRDSARLSRALDFIHDRIEGPMRVGEVAKAAGMSSSAFSRLFRRHMGKPFVQHVNEVRIGHARRLLIETDLSVTEICYRCGFANLSNFNRQFLRHAGQSPNAFRRSASGGRL